MADRRATTAISGEDDREPKAVEPGDVIGGRYVVEESLGAGGMGIVFAARHEALGHRVAIKLLSGSTANDADAFVRFSREAKIIANVESDHVVRLIDYGMHVGTPYMVMELLAGCDLGRELARRGPLPIADVASYAIQACSGLWVAHQKGIVHRDVKLANLFVVARADGERQIKVLDFGVSKLQAEVHDDVELTHTTMMIGSPQYTSPEQIRDPRKVDMRADVWSLGVVMYKLLTQEAPFTGTNANAVCAAIVADAPAPLDTYTRIPREVAAIVLRCLEKQPDKRYPNVAALARELAPFATAQGKDVADRLVANAIADGLLDEAPAIVEYEGIEVAPVARRRFNPRWAFAAVAVAIVATVGVVAVGRRGSDAVPASVTPTESATTPAPAPATAPAPAPAPAPATATAPATAPGTGPATGTVAATEPGTATATEPVAATKPGTATEPIAATTTPTSLAKQAGKARPSTRLRPTTTAPATKPSATTAPATKPPTSGKFGGTALDDHQ